MIDYTKLIEGINGGTIRPSSFERKLDEKGHPLTIYNFPDYKCQVHAHFRDEAREEIIEAHIWTYSRKEKWPEPIDNYTLGMLRHFSGDDPKKADPFVVYTKNTGTESKKNTGTKTKPKKSKKKVVIFSILAGLILVMLLLASGNRNNRHHVNYNGWITLNQSVSQKGVTLVTGKKYQISNKVDAGYLLWIFVEKPRDPNDGQWYPGKKTGVPMCIPFKYVKRYYKK